MPICIATGGKYWGFFRGCTRDWINSSSIYELCFYQKKPAKILHLMAKVILRVWRQQNPQTALFLGASLIPLLTLGIPGSINAALLIGAFMIHGLTPGPTLFEKQAELVYAIFGAMIFANIVNLSLGLICMRVWSRVVKAPETIVFFRIIYFMYYWGVFIHRYGVWSGINVLFCHYWYFNEYARVFQCYFYISLFLTTPIRRIFCPIYDFIRWQYFKYYQPFCGTCILGVRRGNIMYIYANNKTKYPLTVKGGKTDFLSCIVPKFYR